MTYRNLQKPILLLVLIPLSIGLLWKVFRNETDPLWGETADLLRQNIVTLDKSPDSLHGLYHHFHDSTSVSDSAILRLIAKPYMPNMAFAKFRTYLNLISERKFLIVSGVTGAGNSTLVDRIANLIANETESTNVQNADTQQWTRKMEILCAPQFDLDLHHQYIGFYDKKTFIKGDLLKFWERCKAQPQQRFVCVIDNFDKINPETFFGPQLWQKLDDAKFNVVFGRDTISIPDNFYLLCVTHAGVGQKIEMNNEHFKRFGGQENLPPTPIELVLALKTKKKEVEKELIKKKDTPQYDGKKKDISKLENQLTALQDTPNLQRFVYFFSKANEFIAQKYSSGHQLGQWSDVRKQFQAKDFDNLQDIFINHVNAFHPQNELRKADFEPIIYSMNNEGSVKNSSLFWRAADKLTDWGFASELGVAGLFALISGIFGWWYFRQRHQYIKDFTGKIYDLMADYHQNRKPHDQLVAEINDLKNAFDDLVLTQKVNYNEASFFYGFLENKVRDIQIGREINESFLKLMDVFLEDNVLSDSEYAKLKQFLESIRFKITTPQYQAYKKQIEETYQKYGG
jgi:energy-coupling factor transporter ATP-binding protein EcfA2